jgi:hypothetical protein
MLINAIPVRMPKIILKIFIMRLESEGGFGSGLVSISMAAINLSKNKFI